MTAESECCGGARWHVGADRDRRGAVARCRARRERVLQQLLKRFGGRGGGKPELAQGAGLTGDPQEIVAAARELLGS
jgi:alanyl-tRNA synthetase